jgi:hypothetical protein
MAKSLEELAALVRSVFPDSMPPKPLHVLLAASDVLTESLSRKDAARKYRTSPAAVARVTESDNPLGLLLGGEFPVVDDVTGRRTRAALGQLLIGNLAERVFEEIYRDSVGPTELELRDDRGARGETDYLLFNGHGRQVFRLNIKFHGATFRNAKDLVGLDPEDCFALATYKIGAATNKQTVEHLPYIFLIVGVRGLTGELVGADIPDELVELAALPRMTLVTGVRTIEDRVVDALVTDPDRFGFRVHLESHFASLRSAEWRVLGANRGDQLLRKLLFDRVYAEDSPVHHELSRGGIRHALFPLR